MKEYDHLKIEKKWQKEWEKKKVFLAKNKGKKYYSLMEFPYPSGDGLHTGHVRGYTAMDIVSRKRRMEGYDVMFPIGWDAFGLPTENYAIKTGIQPAIITKRNTDNYRKQFQSLGMSFDWSREINTTDPKYYKWTQWIFLQFFKKGLAYKAKSFINWCLSCKTGLANEEVVNGQCERCGGDTEKREKEQWMLSITKYADRLDKDLDTVDYLPQIKLAQRNWIGRSEGAEIEFKIVSPRQSLGGGGSIKVFTTRPDTIFGVTFIAVSPEIAKKIAGKDFGIKSDTDRENKEKIGVDTGLRAKNPANDEMIPVFAVNYVSKEYGTGAIMGVPGHDERDFEFAKKYGLLIKRVIEPCFITKSGIDAYKENEPLVERNAILAIVKHWSEDKYIGLKWKKVNWQTLLTGGPEGNQTLEEGAVNEIREETGYKNPKLITKSLTVHSKFFHVPKNINRFAHLHTLHFQLQNGEKEEISDAEKMNHEVFWLTPNEMEKFLTPEAHKFAWDEYKKGFQQYAGEGVLINSGQFDGVESEKAKKEIVKFVGGKEKTTFKLRDWIFSRQRYWGEPIPIIHCEKCGYIPVPEKDLPVELPKVKNYQPTDSGESPLANISKWVNVKCPKCKGSAKRETDTMPNWAGSSWYYLRYVDPKNSKKFADPKKLKYWTPVNWYNGGMEHTTLHLLYSRFWHKFLFDLGLVPTSEPYKKRTSHGLILAEGGEKMSKSKGNVINPDDIVKRYGADTLRLYEMFMGPFDQAIAWSEEAIIGPRRFLEKVWKLSQQVQKNSSGLTLPGVPGGSYTVQNSSVPASRPATNFSLSASLNKTIKKVSEDIESMKFNTAISALMIFVNESETNIISRGEFEKFIKLLSPFAPHITEELWQNLGHKNSIQLEPWPEWDTNLIIDEEVKIVIQVNGKVRGEIVMPNNAAEEDIKNKALANPAVLKHIQGKNLQRVIYVKNKLINIVV